LLPATTRALEAELRAFARKTLMEAPLLFVLAMHRLRGQSLAVANREEVKEEVRKIVETHFKPTSPYRVDVAQGMEQLINKEVRRLKS
jgi:hypothetical protein